MRNTHPAYDPIATQRILSEAFIKIRAFDQNGRLIDENAFYAGKVLSSASQRLTYGKSRDAGSVERLYFHMYGMESANA